MTAFQPRRDHSVSDISWWQGIWCNCSKAYQGSRLHVQLIRFHSSRRVTGVLDLQFNRSVNSQSKGRSPGQRLTVAVAMIFSNRCSNCEISVLMRSDEWPRVSRTVRGQGSWDQSPEIIIWCDILCSAFAVGWDSISRGSRSESLGSAISHR